MPTALRRPPFMSMCLYCTRHLDPEYVTEYEKREGVFWNEETWIRVGHYFVISTTNVDILYLSRNVCVTITREYLYIFSTHRNISFLRISSINKLLEFVLGFFLNLTPLKFFVVIAHLDRKKSYYNVHDLFILLTPN